MSIQERPLLELNENATDLKKISSTLVKLINFLLNNSHHTNNGFNSIVLWISSTNGYVSCHWYNSEDDKIDESYNYTVANFHEYYNSLDTENDEFFYNGILMAIGFIDKELINSWKIDIYQTDETNEPEKME